jgi:hypothetical protein
MNLAPATLLNLILLFSLSQQQTAKQLEVNPFNVPDEVRTCMRATRGIQINAGINPFYISGDYDGDGFTDFAIQVKATKSGSEGILFCFASRPSILLGAGEPVVWPQNDSWPFDSWMLIRKGSKHLSIYPKIKFDTVALIKADEGGGLLYWDGSKFLWQREE